MQNGVSTDLLEHMKVAPSTKLSTLPEGRFVGTFAHDVQIIDSMTPDGLYTERHVVIGPSVAVQISNYRFTIFCEAYVRL